jgi:PAS domain S-box-containing protein
MMLLMQDEASATRVGLKRLTEELVPAKLRLLLEGQSRLLEMIARSAPLTTVLEELMRILEEQLDGTACAVLLLSADRKHLRHGAAPSLPESFVRSVHEAAIGPLTTPCDVAASAQRPVIVSDIARDPRWADYKELALGIGLKACWSVPIFSECGEALGTFAMYHREPSAPTPMHLGLIDFATRLARIAVERNASERDREHRYRAEAFAERYRMVLQATREAVWDCNLETGAIHWNDGLTALGYELREVGLHLDWWFERIHPQDEERVHRHWDQALLDPKTTLWEDEYRFQRKDGAYADVIDRGLIARDRSGKAVRMVGSLQDVTRRKRHAQELEQLAERLKSATKAASVGTWHLDLSTELFRADASLNRLIGREETETVQPWSEALRGIHPADRGRLVRARDDSIATGCPFAVEHRMVLADGEIRWLRSRGRVFLDEQGHPTAIAGAVADITDLRRAEQSMTLLAEASRLLAESLDVEETLSAMARMAIPSFADGALVHLKDAETGEPRLVVTHAADPVQAAILYEMQRMGTYRVQSPSRRVLRTGRSELHTRVTADWVTGEELDEEIAALIRRFHVSSVLLVPIVLNGEPVGVLAFWSTGTRHFDASDVGIAEELGRRASNAMQKAQLLMTAKVERARAERAKALRERLLAIVGHDLRSPLNAISVASELLGRRELGPSEGALVRRIEASAGRMNRMIGQILDFARIREGMSLPMDLQPANVHEICRAVVDELRLANPNRQIQLDIAGHGEAICDADRIAEALSNLVGNAIQHGKDGPVSITVSDRTSDTVAIEIHNVGAPIPKNLQTTIFDPYRRETTRSDRRTKSVGLGLCIASEIVQAHGGSIAVRSPDRNGTTFAMLIARRPSYAPREDAPRPPPVAPVRLE